MAFSPAVSASGSSTLDPISARRSPLQCTIILVIPTEGPRRLRAVVEGSWLGHSVPLPRSCPGINTLAIPIPQSGRLICSSLVHLSRPRLTLRTATASINRREIKSEMKLAYFDCFSGISGDMTLGALVHAGVPLEQMRE